MPTPKKKTDTSGGAKPIDDYEDGPDKEEDDDEQSDDIDEKTEESDTDNEEEQVEEDNDAEPTDDKDDDAPSKSKQYVDAEEDYQDDETCLYNIKQKLDTNILDSDEFDEELFADEKVVQTKRIVKQDERITKPILTKYERVRLLSERRKQLILGAKPMIKVSKSIPEKEIANLELKAKVIPIIIVRTLPNGDIEHWKLDELEIIN